MRAEREARESMLRPLPVDTLWVRFVFVDHAGIPKTKATGTPSRGRRVRGWGSPRGC
jgi:hypothetical protein